MVVIEQYGILRHYTDGLTQAGPGQPREYPARRYEIRHRQRP